MSAGVTLDTGALIALVRGKSGMSVRLKRAAPEVRADRLTRRC
jgi:hypothetical protein